QIQESADSAPALIAEGFRRFTTPEFVRYLRMARGELGEVQNDLEIARRRRYLTAEQFSPLNVLARRAMGTTTNLPNSTLRTLHEAHRQKRKERPPRPPPP